MDHLPDELLADILRRLLPRGIAACQAVCKGWRDAVDAAGLLLAVAPLVPRPMRGIFVNFSSIRHDRPYLFSRGPTVNPSIALDACALDFMHRLCRGCPRETILDHRNGLLLYNNGVKMSVCNPVTCRWAELPPMPFRWPSAAYLVFDPVVSLHYDVLIFRNTGKGNTPPCAYMIPVYSSKTDQWEEWPFIREGDATAITMVSGQLGDPKCRGAVYWRGALYLHCCSGLLISHGYYMDSSKPRVYLGKSEEGVYYTTIYQCKLQVWVLLEASCPMPEWVLKHYSNIVPCIQRHYYGEYYEGEKANKPCIRGDCEWEFIGGSVHDSEEQEGKAREGQRYYYDDRHIELLGYHPFKDIAFLGINNCDGFAYYLGTCQLRYLGSIMSPTRCSSSEEATIQESFIYTPCKDDLLPNHEESVEELFEESFINMYLSK
ncbi:hypothetical protein VPH35_011375 [Triticum aestivum]